jgi:hypothetical protein
MNITVIPAGFLFIVIGMVVVAILMGRRSSAGRIGSNWWIGLVVMLVAISIIFGWTRTSFRSIREERNVPARTVISEARQEIEDQAREVGRTIKDTVSELKENLEEIAKGASAESKGSGKAKSKTPPRAPTAASTPPPPRPPAVTKTWLVKLDVNERSGSEARVREYVVEKAHESVRRWVCSELPVRCYLRFDNTVMTELGLTPDKVDIVDESFTLNGQTENVYTGSMKVVLTPQLQESLKTAAFEQASRFLERQKEEEQFIVFGNLMGMACLAILLGAYRSYRFWSRSRQSIAVPAS